VANRLFQTVIHQMKGAMLGREAGVIDESATVIACTDVNEIGAVRELAASRAKEIIAGNDIHMPSTIVDDRRTPAKTEVMGVTRNQMAVCVKRLLEMILWLE